MTGPSADDAGTGAAEQAHPDSDTLADLHAGVLSSAETSWVRAHVDACETCRESLAQIAAVPGVLGAMPADPMPADVTERMAEAIRAEVSGPGSGADNLAGHRTARARPRSWWRSPAAGAAAAALVALVGIGVGIGVVLAGNNHDSTTTANSLTRPNAMAGAPITATGNAYTEANLDGLVSSLVAGTPASTLESDADAVPAPASAFADRASAPTAASEPGATTAATAASLRARLGACAQELEPSPGQEPLAVDIGTYQGRPAAVFVYAAPSGGEYYAYVVKATDACPGGVFSLWHRIKASPAG